MTSSTRNDPATVGKGAPNGLTVGMALPRIALPASAGSDVCLAELPGSVLVFIYPWTGRPGTPNPPNWDEIPGAHGSTPEIEAFRDLAAQFEACELAIYGLSRQATDYQREMANRLKVPFPFLSDSAGEFARAVGLPSFTTGGETYYKRLSIILNHGVVETVFYPIPRPEMHARDVLRRFRRERCR